MFNIIKRRYSDNDYHLWPFTFSISYYKPVGIVLDSGDSDYPGCNIKLYLYWITIICELPPLIRPCGKYGDNPREYGVTINGNFINVMYGRQTNDSETGQRWGTFTWFDWRFVRHSLYDIKGDHFYTSDDKTSFGMREDAEQLCPSITFEFDDYDGERITAKTTIEEREWRYGTGWLKWLSVFIKPKISGSLHIRFSKETGREKGSWKGGTTGHGIELVGDELHESAFRRYCSEHEMTFIGVKSV